MSKKLSFPKVLLVGRTNVGKSTIFNRLVGDKVSIVLEREHVTRDYLSEPVTWDNKTFELVDTGGLSFSRGLDEITQKIQQKVLNLLNEAAVILFICDAKHGINDEDRKIAKTLHKTGTPVFVFLNKADNTTAYHENMSAFYALGFKDIFPVSAIHGTGIGDMLDLIIENLPDRKAEEVDEPTHKIAIIGKPNVGKSSLMNELVKQERSIVSDVAGTTREAINQNVFYYSDLLQLTDTAGVRKKARIDDNLEELMVKSSLSAVRQADTVILMIDASQGRITDQELKLLFYAYENKKMMLIILNKIDLLDDYNELMLRQSLEENRFIFDKIPQLKTSCITMKNVGKVFAELEKIWTRANQKIDAIELNEIMHAALERKKLFHKTIPLSIHKVIQLNAKTPTFLLSVNIPEHFGESELKCIENILRENYDFKGCAIKFVLKKNN